MRLLGEVAHKSILIWLEIYDDNIIEITLF
nr:MAG TPA: hypothetical protein [Caudoviricetes sp.]